jgi:magnesium transporter
LQLLHGKPPSWGDIVRKLRWEFLTGLLLGIGSAVLVGLVAWIWLGQFRVVLCLLGGIGGGITFAAIAGIAIPNLLHMMRRNPQVAAGPIVLALADITTLLVYLNLSRWLLT